MVQKSRQMDISEKHIAAWDFTTGILRWRLWAYLGVQDIRQRYRRSSLGPLWLTLGLGVTILGIGLLYSQILKTPPGTFIPFIAISLLAWNFLSTVVTESTTAFQAGAGLISSVRVPYTTFVLRCLVRNLIVAAHCILPVVIAFVYYKYPVDVVALAALPGLVLMLLNMYWLALCLAMVCLRYRDVAQIVIYAMQLALFVTPIIWQPTQLRAGTPFLAFNPIYHLIELIRAPIFEHRVPLASYQFSAIMLVVGGAITALVFNRFRRDLAYWI
ncbi:ABC transporter permease [Caulobacter sp. D4A]|nr:ABC transporter permease [Caulobacter sp. D4A]PXA92253.1 ABC transporter permease [Caulobacter sp. D5]